MEKNTYAIYSYKFIEANDEGDWTQGVFDLYELTEEERRRVMEG
jgi:hypothetical protein